MAGRDRRSTCEAGRALRARGTAEDAVLARPDRPRRWTFPITALRVMPPSSPAIWLADSPSAQSFLSRSTRSSVQLMSLRSPVRFILGLSNGGTSCGRRSYGIPHASGDLDGPPDVTRHKIGNSVTSAARDVVVDTPKATIWGDSHARVAGLGA